jgi:hypothetical protein
VQVIEIDGEDKVIILQSDREARDEKP